jgi:hypothetical protein
MDLISPLFLQFSIELNIFPSLDGHTAAPTIDMASITSVRRHASTCPKSKKLEQFITLTRSTVRR